MLTLNIAFGLAFGVCSGILSGSYGVFMKKIKKWNWENTWLVYSFWALLVFPGVLVITTIPGFWNLLDRVPILTLGTVFLFGAGWGLSNIGFGIGLRELGLALTSVIVIGIGNALGTILPLAIYHPESLLKPVGLYISTGTILSVLGIALCSLVTQPEKDAKHNQVDRCPSLNKGLFICIGSGILSILFNFALILGKPLEQQAILLGAAPQNASNATWCVAFLGGFTVTAIYCIKLLLRNRSFEHFRFQDSVSNYFFTLLMGFIWFSGIVLYGISVLYFGQFGPSIGWPIFQSIQILTANLLGIATGEWKGLSKNIIYLRIAGIMILIIGIAIISWAGEA